MTAWLRGCRALLVALGGLGGLSGLPLPAAAQAAQAIVVQDDRGATLRFAAPPQRIVSLLPSLTEAVCALGACSRLVGVDRYSNWPASVLALPKLGGLDDAEIERTVALKPDIVLAATSARVTERLEALGLKVLVLDSQSHADVQRALGLIAKLLGEPDRAPRLWAGIQADLTLAASRVPPRLRGRKVYFEIDSAPYAAGVSSFIGQTLARLGLGNVVSPALGPFPKLNPEFIVRAQPDIVMAGAREIAAMPARPGWAGLRALQQGQTCGFDSVRYELLIRPGPRLGEAALVLADCLAGLPAR
jgi:iron complex transport system substrate-binding protein